MEVENRFVTMVDYIKGQPSESNFEIRSSPLPSLSVTEGSGEILVRNLYLSVDPYLVNRMKEYSSSQPAIYIFSSLVPGQRIDAPGIGEVVASADPGFQKGDFVAGLLEWAEYSSVVVEGSMIRKIDSREFPLSYHAGLLGFSGFTAYFGFYDVCKPKRGEKVYVSAASGSVGYAVGQYAKTMGCYVVGSTGTKQKVDILKDKLGFDDAFNYKEESDLTSTLKRYFPEGIDIYFDNVGGEMLEAAVANMNDLGRVVVCGVISEYTSTRRAAPNFLSVLYKGITIQGFRCPDYMHRFQEFISFTSDLLKNGKFYVLEDISQGLESVPSAFCGLFRGDNVGKKLVQIASEGKSWTDQPRTP